MVYYRNVNKIHIVKLILKSNNTSSRSQMFFKTKALENFAKTTRKHICRVLFLIKL